MVSVSVRYLDNVIPEIFIPDENVHAYGVVMNQNPRSTHKLCLDTLGKHKGTFHVGAYSCSNVSSNQVIFFIFLNILFVHSN